VTVETTPVTGPWRDPDLPVAERVADLMARMTVEEKAQQLVGYWPAPSAPGGQVAPRQDDFSAETPPLAAVVAAGGLGQLTRPYGTAPVAPRDGLARLRDLQDRVAGGNRFGIPAIVHEECLTGLATWTATAFPTPLAWGAAFDADLVEQMASAIGHSMRRLGVHQGLAPVLDVTRDLRWGRTEETIGEDPFLVGTIGAAYVRGLERTGVVATLKHFAGYSTSRAGRNFAPATAGPRELADVIVEPFLMGLREGGARSVMHAYTDNDGVPAAADPHLLTDLLRDELGFGGIVVADYYGISFLETLHGVAGSPERAAALALTAGVDVELPTIRCYGPPLARLVRDGTLPEDLLDRSVRRVLSMKCELGLLDAGWDGALEDLAARDDLDHLDPPGHRALARRLAEQSVVVLANEGVLPLTTGTGVVALVGPLADDSSGMLGCYTFPSHVGVHHPDVPIGVEVPTLADALRDDLGADRLVIAPGCTISDLDPDAEAFTAAVAAAREAPLAIVALGDRSGLFGRGTSGEGCDAVDLQLPGRQADLAAAVLDTGTPTILVVLSGRPYALGGLAEQAAAVVQAFLPGEEGGHAVSGVLTGRVDPSGRLPVSVPRHRGGQPATYLHAPLGGRSDVSSADPTPLYPFGHGLTWTTFAYDDLEIAPLDGTATAGGTTVIATDGAARISATVRNSGDRSGTEVVQLYLHDPVASVVRPVRWLAGWARVRLDAGQRARVTFTVHADRTSFTGVDLRRVVEPGRIDVSIGSSSDDLPLRGTFELDGPVRTPGRDRVLTVPTAVEVR
jgi:beta-glucosidase-like glycosyl hydrolase